MVQTASVTAEIVIAIPFLILIPPVGQALRGPSGELALTGASGH